MNKTDVQDLIIYKQYLELIYYTEMITEKYPKVEKLALVTNIKNNTYEGMKKVILAYKYYDKQELQDRINELTDNVNNLEALINEKEYEISILQGTIDNLTTEKNNLTNELTQANSDKTTLQNQINELNGTIATLQSSIEAKDNEIKTLNGEKKELQTSLDTKTAELTTLNENLGKVTATASDVLNGKTILTSNGLITGSMTNNGSISQTLNAGGSYTIPKGYHDGTGKVTANTLSSQTSATAAASNLLSGKTAWVNGSKITGSMTNKSGATVSATTVTESGTNALITIPSSGYYDTSSKISVPIETIRNEIMELNSSSVMFLVQTSSTGAGDASVTVSMLNGEDLLNPIVIGYKSVPVNCYNSSLYVDYSSPKWRLAAINFPIYYSTNKNMSNKQYLEKYSSIYWSYTENINYYIQPA